MAETKLLGWISRLLGCIGKSRPPPVLAVKTVEIHSGLLDAGMLPIAAPLAPTADVPPLHSPPVTIGSTQALDLANLPTAPAAEMRILVHVSMRGDVEAALETWAGQRRSGLQIEGFAVRVISSIKPDEIEYHALLDDGTITSWHRGETYCGTRGASRPLRGFALRLVGIAASAYRISYAAVFLDGSEVGPVANGALCAADSEAGLEAIYVMIDPARDNEAG